MHGRLVRGAPGSCRYRNGRLKQPARVLQMKGHVELSDKALLGLGPPVDGGHYLMVVVLLSALLFLLLVLMRIGHYLWL